MRRDLGDLGIPVHVETDAEWIERMRITDPAETSETDAQAKPAAPQPLSAADGAEAVDAESAIVDLVDARPAGARPPRVRLVGPRASVRELHLALAHAVEGDPDLAIYAGEVTTAGRIELLPFLREQAISITAHRFGNPDPTFRDVI